ncbi:amino acid ABC transporter substrate-binding protein, PAAT family [Desulfonispora thiosulfatigenes DSM 11270]|uniref:Amino acid ABC transporter substrate-binding protein, PAAT family n=1 Tax=Desulfonispora thiosulfatigenes DSM 11270 TaxID=656914 RepID=A0A1W1UX57_DESTI|nr:basic amino acid ABC transporter substrate-binding protein [Desulfonispora thiosulfatigenes]SMB85745.1 amino acid ABC transporter substrate-binding protein, PAAT family [Desulfonispora thiosulfatigenes DSM 11270]
MKRFLSISLIMLMMLSIVALAGCAKTEKPAEENAQGDEDKVYIVGTEPTFAPFEMKDEKTGEITGFDIELIKAIAEDQGFKVEVQAMGFDGLINAIKTGTIDIVASGMTIDEARQKEVDFSTPYINSGLALAVQADNEDIKSVNDLKGKVVSVQIGSTGAKKAQELKDQGLLGEVKTFDTVDIVMREVDNGNVDGTINDLPVTNAYIVKSANSLKVLENLTSEEYGFAVQKGNDLKAKIDAGLKNVKENGKYAELEQKYFQ